MENNLKEIISDINKKNEVVLTEKSVEELTDPHARRTRQGHIKRAKEDLKELYLQYRTAIKDKAVFILVTGSLREKFASTSEKSFNCFQLDASSFYKDLLSKVPEKLYTNYKPSPALFDHINARFEDRANDIEIIGFRPIIFESKYSGPPLKGFDDALKVVKRAFNAMTGGEVVGLDAIDRVTAKAVKEQFTGKTVPIVLYTEDEALIEELYRDFKEHLTQNVFLISAGDNVNDKLKTISLDTLKTVTKKSVESSLLKVKENLN